MSCIDKPTRERIRQYLERFIEGILQEYRRWQPRQMITLQQYLSQQAEKANLKPFHDALIPEEFRQASALERSLSTRLGATFEECARLIASQHHPVARRGYRIAAQLDADALAKLEEYIQRVDKGNVPPLREMVQALLAARTGRTTASVRIVADLYVQKDDGTELFFELKSPVPNKGQCLEVTQRLLRIQLARGKGLPSVQTFFAMPYNPYGGGRENYRWDYARRYLPFEDAVLIGAEFWDMLGGEGTYLELLEIYHEVGQAKATALRGLFHAAD